MTEPRHNPTRARHELLAILALARSEKELDALVEGLFTPPELEDLVRRWRLLQRLEQDEAQRGIARDLGVSLGTIARGSRLLKYGPARFRDLVRRSLESGPPPAAGDDGNESHD